MQIQIKNFRGIEHAEFELNPVALVAGANEAGKSSTAQALAAALSQHPTPLAGLKKNQARDLLRTGTSRGACKVADDAGTVTVNWPGGSVSPTGNPPAASDVALGLVSLPDLKANERASMLIQIMDALPSEDDLAEALRAHGIPDKVIPAVWEQIQAKGWDAAHKRAQEKGRELKGAWGQITGENWGQRKGEDWTPAELPEQGADPDQELSDERIQLEELIANQAGDQARREQLEAEASRAVGDPSESEGRVAEIDEKVAALREDLQALPEPVTGQGGDTECPHCGTELVVRGKSVALPEAGLSDEDNQARQDAIDALKGDINDLLDERERLQGDINDIRAEIARRDRAAQELQNLSEGTVTAEQVDEQRERVRAAERRVKAARAYAEAHKQHRAILQNMAIAEELAPEGLRQRVLADRLAAFNRTLAHISADGGWPSVQIEQDLSITYGGRAYALASASAQFRVRATLQLATAGMDGSAAVIIDAADILDREGRNGLFKAVRATQLRALICMTIDKSDDVPRLQKAGIGQSYFLSGGVMAPLE